MEKVGYEELRDLQSSSRQFDYLIIGLNWFSDGLTAAADSLTKRNIDSALYNKGTTYATTDNLGEVNHPVTDVRKLDSDGNILKNYQRP